MCGIAGFISPNRDASQFAGWLSAMVSAIRHRGPDQGGLFFDHVAGLGSARLSVIDLDHGMQPICDESKRYWLVYNGELFNYIELREELIGKNHTFQTRSDTEVLLRALIQWDTDALHRLNGQFGFSFYDKLEQRLILARDPFGERPLFYMNDEEGICFASEIKSLFSLPFIERRFDTDALAYLYRHWALPFNKSSFEGVSSLPPGHYAVYHNRTLRTAPYYRLPTDRVPLTNDLAEAKKLMGDSLKKSVELRLRSDVEVGAYLSGGIDSSITTLLAGRAAAKPLHTFSIEFADPAFDETNYQQALAKQLGTQHHSVRITNSDIVQNFEKVIWHAETALFRTAPVPMFLLSGLVKENGIKVVLSGEGADESFLGYNIFKETLLRHEMAKGQDHHTTLEQIAGLYPYLHHFDEKHAAILAHFYRGSIKEKTPPLFSHEPRFANGNLAEKLLHTGSSLRATDRLANDIRSVYPDLGKKHPLVKAQVLEFWTLLGGYLLCVQGDRMSAANGIESRCPFLDRNLVETAWGLPHEFRLSQQGIEKFILKELFRDQLPHRIINRPKQPYRSPDSVAFLEKQHTHFVGDLLTAHSISQCGIFDEKAVARFVKNVLNKPKQNISPREDQAFILLLSTVLLHRQFISANLPEKANRYGRPLRIIDGRDLQPKNEPEVV